MRAQDAGIVFLGASIMEGWRSVATDLWRTVLEPAGVLNLGVPGEVSGQLWWRIEHAGWLRGLSPRTVVLQVGANDRTVPAADVAQTITDIVRATQRLLPQASMVVCTIHPTDAPGSAMRRKNDETNRLLQALHAPPRLHVLDAGPLLVDAAGATRPDLMPDGLHLSPEGYRVWAQVLFPLLALPPPA